MIKAVLFDLDGTLLPLDTDNFVKKYFQEVAKSFAHKVDPSLFLKALLFGTNKMVENNGEATNEEVFFQNFLPMVDMPREEVFTLFENFYIKEFPKLKEFAGSSPVVQQILERTLDRNLKIVLATNPLFPLIAVEERMRWAGIDGYPWTYITSYENSRSCKPNPLYFQEILDKLNLLPEECIMIGNDAEEDLVAGTLGMKTFLVTDYLIDKGEKKYQPDYSGKLQELSGLLF